MSRSRSSFLLAGLLAGLLTVLFWPKLWQGAGIIGGDTYTYFFPQKAFYADALRAGEFPLWNNLVGHGFPLLGESQTAALYPPNLLLSRLFDLNTAYVISHLAHYWLAWMGCWLLGRRLDLNGWGAAFAATVYTYSWFPPRLALELAIIGGAWLPLALWAVESTFQTGRHRYLAALAAIFGMDLLAGHYNLAFITSLATGSYVVGRWWFGPPPRDERQRGRQHARGSRAANTSSRGNTVGRIRDVSPTDSSQRSEPAAGGGTRLWTGGSATRPVAGAEESKPADGRQRGVRPWLWPYSPVVPGADRNPVAVVSRRYGPRSGAQQIPSGFDPIRNQQGRGPLVFRHAAIAARGVGRLASLETR
ncbi:MAG: hypothetical protein R3B90_12245 [Planctomycetaceae bacterium]